MKKVDGNRRMNLSVILYLYGIYLFNGKSVAILPYEGRESDARSNWNQREGEAVWERGVLGEANEGDGGRSWMGWSFSAYHCKD